MTIKKDQIRKARQALKTIEYNIKIASTYLSNGYLKYDIDGPVDNSEYAELAKEYIKEAEAEFIEQNKHQILANAHEKVCKDLDKFK